MENCWESSKEYLWYGLISNSQFVKRLFEQFSEENQVQRLDTVEVGARSNDSMTSLKFNPDSEEEDDDDATP